MNYIREGVKLIKTAAVFSFGWLLGVCIFGLVMGIALMLVGVGLLVVLLDKACGCSIGSEAKFSYKFEGPRDPYPERPQSNGPTREAAERSPEDPE